MNTDETAPPRGYPSGDPVIGRSGDRKERPIAGDGRLIAGDESLIAGDESLIAGDEWG